MKLISGYDNYFITEEGQVYNAKFNRYLKLTKTKNGYYFVNLSKNGAYTSHYVHRLVAEAFIPNPDNKPEVNHIDEDKSNNSVSNLEWVTRKENINSGTVIQRSSINRGHKVKCIETGIIYSSFSSAAKAVGSDCSTLRQCALGIKGKTCKGFHWTVV